MIYCEEELVDAIRLVKSLNGEKFKDVSGSTIGSDILNALRRGRTDFTLYGIFVKVEFDVVSFFVSPFTETNNNNTNYREV